ncbi:MAG: hypothetical protein GEU94_10555 [Micromonosporaceae bacterium]|nr:hypothetical protein [Micromonosporaceae bacterium]
MGMPRRRPRDDEYLLTGLLRHTVCDRNMSPAIGSGGSRIYVCRTGCPRVVVAAPLERTLLLRALIRAHMALYGIGRPGPILIAGLPGVREAGDGTEVSAEETRRWQGCPPLDRRGMLRAAFVRIDIDEYGKPRPVWRHRAEGSAGEGRGPA